MYGVNTKGEMPGHPIINTAAAAITIAATAAAIV